MRCLQAEAHQLSVEVVAIEERFSCLESNCGARLNFEIHLVLQQLTKMSLQQELEDSLGNTVQHRGHHSGRDPVLPTQAFPQYFSLR